MNLAVTPIRRFPRTGLIAVLATAVALLAAALAAPAAMAEFGTRYFDVEFRDPSGAPATQAGSHQFDLQTRAGLNYTEVGPFEFFAEGGGLKDAIVEQVLGLIGDANAIPRCKTEDFLSTDFTRPCPDSTVVGQQMSELAFPEEWLGTPIFNLEPPPGVVVRLGFPVLIASIIIDVTVKEGGDYNVVGTLRNPPQYIAILSSVVELWGDPTNPVHDKFRGACRALFTIPGTIESVEFPPAFKSCPVKRGEPFLTLPTSCTGPVTTNAEFDFWNEPGGWLKVSSTSHDNGEPPNPLGFSGCGKLGFAPRIESHTTTDSAETGTGLDFNVDFNDEGLTNPEGLAQSQTKKVEVTLPEGITVNPSIGEGLGVCKPGDLEDETLSSDPGEGCPNSSKIGTLHLETPLVDEGIDGAVYLAQQDDPNTPTPGAENPFDSLIALYLVLRNTNLGVIVKLPAKVEPDPVTGQLVTTLDNIPQFPFSHFNFHFREGQRAPLISPPACGKYTAEAKFYPSSNLNNPRTVFSDFEITEGVGDGSCPKGGVPPFEPDFEAGALNNNAGSFSPFNMRLQRKDGDQDMTKFSSILPPGVLGSLAGVSKCPDSAVAVAKGKTGREELAAPSCPANSQIGTTLAGAGVGSALTYVGGQVYLGGPYKGAPLSVISVTPAVAGPFDAGTVVVRLGLTLNSKTAEVEVDGAASDPIPHILKGIVLKVRDLRVYVDRDNFTLNPTSCDPSSAKATLFGSFLDVFSPADDIPVDLATRFQAANCLNLGFKPRLNLRLTGGTKRGDHPGLKAIYRPRPGDSNLEGLIVRLPRSAFLDQAHIRTICTRVQFAAENCPKGAQYGFIRAWTPLLDTPLEGPAYLRSSDNKLPDLVFDLQGLVDVEVSTRIDSQKGGIRATLESAPDAPISLVVLKMQGGKKGLIVNSRDLCIKKSRANIRFSAHNGKLRKANPVMRTACKGKGSRRAD